MKEDLSDRAPSRRGLKAITFYVSPETAQKLKAASIMDGYKSMQVMLKEWVGNYVKEKMPSIK